MTLATVRFFTIVVVENNIHQSIFLTPANFEKKTKYINRFNPSVAYTIHQADMLGNLVTACL